MNENRPQLKSKKRKYINNDGLYLQALLLIIVVILAICSIFVREFFVALEIMFSFLMFTMAYNNETSYARSKMTILYILCGIVILVTTLLGLFV